MPDIHTFNSGPSTPSSTPKESAPDSGLSQVQENVTGTIKNAIEGIASTVPSVPTRTAVTTRGESKQRSTSTKASTPKIEVKMPETEKELKAELTKAYKGIMEELDATLERQKKQGASSFEIYENIKRRRKFTIMLQNLVNMSLEKLKTLFKQMFPHIPE